VKRGAACGWKNQHRSDTDNVEASHASQESSSKRCKGRVKEADKISKFQRKRWKTLWEPREIRRGALRERTSSTSKRGREKEKARFRRKTRTLSRVTRLVGENPMEVKGRSCTKKKRRLRKVKDEGKVRTRAKSGKRRREGEIGST